MNSYTSIASDEVCEDHERYLELNDIIGKGLATFLEVGKALTEIKAKKLYQLEYSTWDEYLERKHGIKRQYASRLMKAKVISGELEEMLPTGNNFKLPQNESQMRPLYRLKSAEDRKKAWVGAVKAAGGNHPTRDLVDKEVSELIPRSKNSIEARPPNQELETSFSHDTKPAALFDGSEVADALLVDAYVDADTAQRKLEAIAKKTSLKGEETVSLQKACLAIFSALNELHEKHPTKEIRNGIGTLFREILFNLPIVAAKPGDMEREGSNNVLAGAEGL